MKTVTNIINVEELKNILLTSTKSVIVSLVSATAPKMRVTGNPYVSGKGETRQISIRKVSKANGQINPQYDDNVVNRLKKAIAAERNDNNLPELDEADMENAVNDRFRRGTSWHEPYVFNDRVTALSVNKKTPNEPDYLRFVRRSSGGGEFLEIATGATIADGEVEQYMNEPSTYDNQGLDDENKVYFNVYRLDSIIEISIDGKRYRCSDNLEQYPLAMRGRLLEICEEYLDGDRKMVKAGT